MLRSFLSFLLLLQLPSLARGGSNQEGLDFLAANAKNEGVISLPSGLQYKVLKKGSGAYHPTADSSCSCHYEGKLISGEVFDSSHDRGEPTDFAPNGVIDGWTEAMQLMVEGDKFELYMPSELGYGDEGADPIPGGTALIFQMEILEIKGDKVPALVCFNPADPTGTCNEKEQAYITKMQPKSTEDQQKQFDRLTKMLSQKMASDLKNWIDRRINILKRLLATTDEK